MAVKRRPDRGTGLEAKRAFDPGSDVLRSDELACRIVDPATHPKGVCAAVSAGRRHPDGEVGYHSVAGRSVRAPEANQPVVRGLEDLNAPYREPHSRVYRVRMTAHDDPQGAATMGGWSSVCSDE